MRGLALDPEEFEAERQVILEELSMGLDDPWRSLTREVQTLLFPRHPYRRPVIGYEDTVRGIGVEDAREFYRRHYHPGNAVLVICGSVRPAEAMRLVRKHFGSIEPVSVLNGHGEYRAPMEEPRGEKRLVTKWDDGSRRLCMAWPTVRFGTEEDLAFDLLSVILTSGRLSRLHQRLVHDERIATSVQATNDTRIDGGSFWLFAECPGEVAPERLERSIDEELERLAKELVPAAELRRAVRILESSEAHDVETASDLAEELGEWAIDGDWRARARVHEALGAIPARALREVARRYLGRERRVVGWSHPTSERAPAKREGKTARRGRA
jgi:zinc protease